MMRKRITGLCTLQQKRVSFMVTMAHKAGLMGKFKPPTCLLDPTRRPKWKKFNTYFDETTIKPTKWFVALKYQQHIDEFKTALQEKGINPMGQTLSEPVTAKETSCCENALYRVGSSCMQGWRINMEDAHTHILSLPDDPHTPFFAVYDGHGGAKIAQYAGRHLHKYIVRRPEYQSDDKMVDALQQGFLALDAAMQEEETLKDELAGTTAISIIIKKNKLYCANVGDSRAIACVNGRVCALSYDHKPSNAEEAKRINAAGGWVELNRVNGNLALSRALGDFVFKKNEKKRPEEQIVTAYPDVQVQELSTDWEFVVMACDGIWDVMTNEEVGDFVRMRVGSGMEPEHICEDLMTRCLAPDCQMGGLGCDNMTVVIICFLHNRPYEDLVVRCAQIVSAET